MASNNSKSKRKIPLDSREDKQFNIYCKVVKLQQSGYFWKDVKSRKFYCDLTKNLALITTYYLFNNHVVLPSLSMRSIDLRQKTKISKTHLLFRFYDDFGFKVYADCF